MPVYCYKCKDCKSEFEVRHSMSFEEQLCLECESENVFKIPSLDTAAQNGFTSITKAGSIVDSYIKDAKKEIREEKRRMQTEEL